MDTKTLEKAQQIYKKASEATVNVNNMTLTNIAVVKQEIHEAGLEAVIEWVQNGGV